MALKPRQSVMPDSIRHSRADQRTSSRIHGLRLKAGVTGMVAAVVMMLAAPVRADTPLPPPALADTQLADPAQEARAKALMQTLRCLVCQGSSIADSDADMAASMRALVRTRIARGEQPDAIRRWLIARYGDYVTFDPPLSGLTWPLWLTPIALLAIGAVLARGSFRRRR